MGGDLNYHIFHCKAAAGNVSIWPDGTLYTCATMMPEGKVGDIWQGITDKAVREEYTRMDRIREKCRACPYLPDCTSYAFCPVEPVHCREVRALLKQELLAHMVDEMEMQKALPAEGERN